MIPLQSDKLGLLAHVFNATTTAYTTTSSELDCAGYDIADITVTIGTHATSAGNQMSVLKLKGGSDTNNSNAVDIAAFSGSTSGHSGTSTSFLIPAPDSSNAQVVKFNINARKTKRYLFVVWNNPGSAQGPISVIGRLSRGEQSPLNAAAQGIAVFKNG